MFVEESLKIRSFIENHDIKNKTVLNIGSANKRFRTYVQPYIHENIVEPLEARRCTITHLDFCKGDGVDIQMDVANLSTLKKSYDIVMCCNTFEHVQNREKLGNDLVHLVKKRGYIIVTTPQVYAYHPDPIDTYFRPTVQEQYALLPDTKLIESDTIPIIQSYQSRGITLPLILMKILMVGKAIGLSLKDDSVSLSKELKAIFATWETTYLVVQKQ